MAGGNSGIQVTSLPHAFTIAHEEIEPSPAISWDRDGVTVTRTLQCAWGDIKQLGYELLGYQTWTGSNSRPAVVYHPPHSAKNYGFARCYANKITAIKPFGTNTLADTTMDPVINYENAMVTVVYNTAKSGGGGGGGKEYLVEESLTPATEYVTMPNRKLYWDSSQEVELEVDESPGKIIRMAEWKYVLKGMPEIPRQVFSMIDSCNEYAMYSHSLKMEFGIETLLYNVPILRTSMYESDDDPMWDITYKFTWRESGWNRFLKAGENGDSEFQPIYDDAGAVYHLYPLKDLGELLWDISSFVEYDPF